MWVYKGDCSRPIGDDESFRDDVGTGYPGNWDKTTVPGMQEVVMTPEPVDPTRRTIGNSIKMIKSIPTRVWVTEAVPEVQHNPNDAILLAIRTIENEITQRRLREAVLGGDNGWLAAADAEIATLRSQLV